MADHQRNGNRLLSPTVPLIDVQVSAADGRQQNANLHIVDAYLRLLYIFNPQTALGAGFDESFHRHSPFQIIKDTNGSGPDRSLLERKSGEGSV
jgi:hypothetical protein